MSTARHSQRRRGAGSIASGVLVVALTACSSSSRYGASGATSSAVTVTSTATTRAAAAASAATTSAATTTLAAAPNGTAATTARPTAAPSATTGAATLGAVPDALTTLEAGAEDIIDLVPDASWAKIIRQVDAMRATWTAYRTTATSVDAAMADRVDRSLTALAESARTKAGPGTVQAANDVSGPVIELLAHYDLGRPVQIGRLDVIGRQIVIDAGARDIPAAATQVAKARAEWNALRPDVLGHQGSKVAAETDAALDALDRSASASDAPALADKARELLEIVDAVEGLY